MTNQFSNFKFPKNIKAVALDVGEKRIGIAYSEDGIFAFPLKTVPAGNIAAEILQIAEGGSLERIIIGLPRNMDGSLGFQTDKVKSFVSDNLAKYLDLVEYIDETATSVEAADLMRVEGKDPRKNPGLIDAYSAKIILEDWISKVKGKNK